MGEQFRELFSNTIYSLLTLIFVLMVFYYWFDIPIACWMDTYATNPKLIACSQWIEVIFKSANWLLLSVIAMVIGFYFHCIQKNIPRAKPFLFFAFSGILAFALCFILKVILARYRPFLLINHGLYGFHFFSLKDSVNSMPSGHATAAFAGLYALSRICQRFWITVVLLSLAIMIAISRVIILDHYPSDVIFGACLGILSVIWVKYFMHYPNRSR